MISSVSNININDSSNIETIQNKTVNYYDNASGYLVYPVLNQNNTTQKLPALIMIHENRGLNDNIKATANLLSKQGYVVLAVDLFSRSNHRSQSRQGVVIICKKQFRYCY